MEESVCRWAHELCMLLMILIISLFQGKNWERKIIWSTNNVMEESIYQLVHEPHDKLLRSDGVSYMEPRDFVRKNDLLLSYKAFLSVECQFGVSTDTIFKTRYPLNFKPNSDFVIQIMMLSSYKIREKVSEKRKKIFICHTKSWCCHLTKLGKKSVKKGRKSACICKGTWFHITNSRNLKSLFNGRAKILEKIV